jgi:dienelactone hydrolase
LVHGSGPHDRDESVMSQKPFRDLAEGLASLGIASLRYDKRSFAFPDKMGPFVTIQEEVIDDAQTAIAWLQKSALVDSSKIYVVGHSLGGMLLPRIAKGQGIAGLVFMAAPAVPLEDKIMQQYQYLFSLDQSISSEEQAELDKLTKQLETLRSSTLSKDTAASELPLGLPGAYWLSLRGLQAPREARDISAPMLFLQGERDYQVTKDVDWEEWKKTLGEGKNTTYKIYPELNHLFMTGSTPPSPKDYETPSHVDEQVVRDIAAWIRR